MEERILKKLFKLTDNCIKKDEFPVSAIIYKDNKIISTGNNKRNKSKRTIDHAEIEAITKANKKLKRWRLNDCKMIVTLEPCDMCKTVIKEARLSEVKYLVARYDYKKQNRSVIFSEVKNNNLTYKKNIDDYICKLNNFFKDKR